MYKIKDFYYNVINGISSLCRWVKVIWYDRDWDYSHMFYLEKAKLLHVIKRLEANSYYVGQEIDVRNMKMCVKLIDIIIEDDADGVYVNTKNSSLYKKLIKANVNQNVIDNVMSDIRTEKAINLYYKIKSDNIRKWWD